MSDPEYTEPQKHIGEQEDPQDLPAVSISLPPLSPHTRSALYNIVDAFTPWGCEWNDDRTALIIFPNDVEDPDAITELGANLLSLIKEQEDPQPMAMEWLGPVLAICEHPLTGHKQTWYRSSQHEVSTISDDGTHTTLSSKEALRLANSMINDGWNLLWEISGLSFKDDEGGPNE